MIRIIIVMPTCLVAVLNHFGEPTNSMPPCQYFATQKTSLLLTIPCCSHNLHQTLRVKCNVAFVVLLMGFKIEIKPRGAIDIITYLKWTRHLYQSIFRNCYCNTYRLNLKKRYLPKNYLRYLRSHF